MNANTLVNYRKMIESELAQLSAIDRGLRADLLNAAETTPTILHDYYDHARAERDLDTRLEIHEQQSLRRRQLECALERIRKGAFGVCVKCGDDIAERRLMAQPHAACCKQSLFTSRNEKRDVDSKSASLVTLPVVPSVEIPAIVKNGVIVSS